MNDEEDAGDQGEAEVPGIFDRLPADVALRTISQAIGYIPLKNRWNLAAVCTDFYNIVCEMDQYKHFMKITPKVVRTSFKKLKSN